MRTNWKQLDEAIVNYTSLGFKYIDTPWIVDIAVANITCPEWGNLDMVAGQVLVASAEQGFLQLQVDGKLDGTNYVSCGPCFRLMDGGRSDIHHPYFMKVELFVRCETEDLAKFAARELIIRARNFMTLDAKSVKVDDTSWDLELNGIEIGSYGYRYHEDVGWWAYGTGLALPRLTQALEINNEPSD